MTSRVMKKTDANKAKASVAGPSILAYFISLANWGRGRNCLNGGYPCYSVVSYLQEDV